MRHHVQWIAPATLRGPAPAILRFATDSFMEEFNRVLDTDPSKLAGLEAQFETWRGPGSLAAAVPEPATSASRLERKLARMRGSAERRLSMYGLSSEAAVAEAPVLAPGSPRPRLLKLYQPAHQRFYLVAAALVCRLPGLPDRTIDAGREERAAFVLRRIRSRTVGGATVRDEYGFVTNSSGGSWVKIASPEATLAPGEDKRPLFAVNFQDDADKKRRVLAGLIPTGRREQYVGAPEGAAAPATAPSDRASATLTDPGAPTPPLDPRIALLSADVIEPWKALVVRANKAASEIANANTSSSQDLEKIRDAARENIQVGSWYVLLDFATFLQQHVNDVWTALVNNTTPSSQPQRNVVLAIRGATLPAAVPSFGLSKPANLGDALAAVPAFRERLEQATGGYQLRAPTAEWPTFYFPLADEQYGGPEPSVTPPALPAGTPTLASYQLVLRKISALRDLIAAALPAQPTAPVPELPLAAQPVMAPDETAVFVIRCVFERPECGPLDPPLLSEPSRPFELAAFFDPEAPARAIRISLPVDTSPAGLRRAPKNTAFMVSDMLCGQINRAKGLGFIDLVLSVLPFPLHKGLDSGGPTPCKTDAGLSLGMICSLSIPIITICALIVLIIMVSLLDIIFRWMPFFFFCFPLPKFNAKAPVPQEPA
jgi:hypothetical protein